MLHLVRQTQRAMSDAARLKFTGRAAKTRLEWTMCAGIYTLAWRVITHPASVLRFFFLSLILSHSFLYSIISERINEETWRHSHRYFNFITSSQKPAPIFPSSCFLRSIISRVPQSPTTRRVRKTIMSNHIIDRPWGSSWSSPLFKARRMAFDSPSRDFP